MSAKRRGVTARRRPTKAEREAAALLLEQQLEQRRVNRRAQTANGINAFVGDFVAEIDTAIQELLRSPDSVVPLRRLAYVTRELKSYEAMVKRDEGVANVIVECEEANG